MDAPLESLREQSKTKPSVKSNWEVAGIAAPVNKRLY
jgi:hypothetical protein